MKKYKFEKASNMELPLVGPLPVVVFPSKLWMIDPTVERKMRLRRVTPNVTMLDFRVSSVLFFKGDVLALKSGGFVYTHKQQRTPMETRALEYLTQDESGNEVHAFCRVSENEFYFMLGSELTREGLPLTRLGGNDGN